MGNRSWAVLTSVIGGLVLLAVFNLFSTPNMSTRPRLLTDYSRFIADVEEGKIEQVIFRGSTIAGRFKDGRLFESYLPHAQLIAALTDRLLAKGVTVAARPTEEELPSLLTSLINWLPLLLFYAALYFVVARPMLALTRQMEAYVKLIKEPPSPPPSSLP
jgi:cell division protease FtsH